MLRANPFSGASLLAPFLGLGRRSPPTAAEAAPQPGAAAPEPDGQADAASTAAPPAAGGEQPPAPAATTPPAAAGDQKKNKDGSSEDYEEGSEDEEDRRDREEAAGTAGSVVQHARIRERSRIAAILTHPAAAAQPALARQLAFGTLMGRQEACGVLAACAGDGASPAGGELSAAMAGFAAIRPGADAPPAPTGGKAIEASWDRALERAGLVARR